MKISEAFQPRDKRSRVFTILAVLAISLAWTSAPPWGAYAQEQQQTQSQQAAQIEAKAQKDITDIQFTPVSLIGPIERAEKDGTVIKLSLRDAIKLALQNNLNIAIAETQENLKDLALQSAKAVYSIQYISISASTQKSNSASTQVTNQAESGFISTSSTNNWGVSISQPIATGGSLSLNWNSNRRDSNNTNDLTRPNYGTSTSLSFRQPLWRNLKVDSNRNNIKLANMDIKLNDAQFKQSVTSQIASVQQAYWSLVSAIYAYRNAVGSVQLARTSAANAQKRVEVGVAAPIEYTQTLASQARSEVSVIQAEERILSAQNALKNLISKDRNGEIWGQTIVPTDTPEVDEYKIDLNTAIATAIKNSTQLLQDDLNIERSDLSHLLNLEQKKWQVDVTASIGSSGTGGVQGYRNGKPVLEDSFVGGLFTSYKTVFTGGTYNWSFSFNVQIPIKDTRIQNTLATDRINRQNSLMQRVQHEQNLVVQIRNSVQALQTARRNIDTATISRKLSEAELDSQQKRYEAGLSRQEDVIRAQENLAGAKSSELNAMISYRTAISNLQQQMNTLLEENSINLGTDIPKNKQLSFK